VTAHRAPIRRLLGVPIAATTLREVLDLVHETILARGRLQIGVVNAAKVVNMSRDRILQDDVLSSDIILADGISVVWASRLLRRPLPERVAGIDLMHGMLDRGTRYGYRVFCLGATDDVLRKTTERIAADYPGVKVVGYHDGYFKAQEEDAVAAKIAAARPDILLVAMTSPKKENFLAKWSEQLQIPVCHGVGGSFDVMAGKVRRAPELWQTLGLEWLYRVKQEPGRLWKRYLVTNTLFCRMVIAELLRREPHSSDVGH
jgi:N-acetylglucosaminyldiphosphoundecaprenol N-acetyl-beta-D-mannosaminyltransferase